MTEKRSEEERRRLNEDEPEVEGHKFRHGAEGAEEAGRRRLNEDDEDDTPDVEGHRYQR